ncbi:flagellar hook-basal body complex protein FliE [Mediterraneibacter agrestimuris]|uniref:flagellar hook-basal body complex protein FliE n=1 Tax=Mediterraneibacter agrestimuris TaxID=2941333 RepID=UPI00203F0935|nr:flagellar hook-basal body complex protein FliE [Mediterraneibacter agrestimuris]
MKELFIEPMRPMLTGLGTERISGNQQQIDGQIGGGMFQSVFKEVVGNVTQTENDLADKQYLLATGQIEDPHSVMVASSQAQLAVDMLVSLRNKALESYNELMRISL